MTDLTNQAVEGYDGLYNPHLATSASWYGHKTGQALALSGRTKPTKATMGRGYSVNVWAGGTKLKVIFNNRNEPTIIPA